MKQSALRKVRRQRRFRQDELAAFLNIRQNTISKMEARGIKKRSTAERYAVALGCDWKDLID